MLSTLKLPLMHHRQTTDGLNSKPLSFKNFQSLEYAPYIWRRKRMVFIPKVDWHLHEVGKNFPLAVYEENKKQVSSLKILACLPQRQM